MTLFHQIAEIENQITKIENNPDNVIGGLKAWNSGKQTYYKPAVVKKLQKLNKELDKLLGMCDDQ